MAALEAPAPASDRASRTVWMSRTQDIHLTHLRHILVSASAYAKQDWFSVLPVTALRCDPTHGMRRLERGDDSFEATEKLKSLERLAIRDGNIPCASDLLEIRMLRSDARIVQTR